MFQQNERKRDDKQLNKSDFTTRSLINRLLQSFFLLYSFVVMFSRDVVSHLCSSSFLKKFFSLYFFQSVSHQQVSNSLSLLVVQFLVYIVQFSSFCFFLASFFLIRSNIFLLLISFNRVVFLLLSSFWFPSFFSRRSRQSRYASKAFFGLNL